MPIVKIGGRRRSVETHENKGPINRKPAVGDAARCRWRRAFWDTSSVLTTSEQNADLGAIRNGRSCSVAAPEAPLAHRRPEPGELTAAMASRA
jgi:hypothetical protein